MKYSRPRGTQDILPPDVFDWRRAESVFDQTFQAFGYDPVRTPIFESTDLFLRVGEETDIVSKEMYTFDDRGGRSMTLRPENTAAVIRAYLENGMHRLGGVTRLAYIGPMFRYDRPQAGRFRQFHQVGVEAIGSLNPLVDVEVIDVVMSGLESLGFEGLTVKLNSVGCSVCRGPYLDVLRKALAGMSDRLCEDCRTRADKNPMRVLDCKKDQALKAELPKISDHLCEECTIHFARVRELLDAQGREYDLDPMLVRGLDYYTKTTFEILHGELGAQNALCGGGRYDDLIEQCGGPSTPAVGFSAGLERIISVMPAAADASIDGMVDFYVVVVDEGAEQRAMLAATALRDSGRVEVDPTGRALKKQLKAAEKSGARCAVIVDSESTTIKVKDMARREQSDVADADLRSFAAELMKKGK